MRIITWSITEMLRDSEGYVELVRWSCDGVDGENTARQFGHTEYKKQDGEDVIPFDTLTEEQVLSWVLSDLAHGDQTAQDVKEFIEGIVNHRLDNPKYIGLTSGLPW